MINENNFSIDVNAESQAMGFGGNIDDVPPSEFVNIQSSVDLPPSLFPTPQTNQDINVLIPEAMPSTVFENDPSNTLFPKAMEMNAFIEDPIIIKATETQDLSNLKGDLSKVSGIDYNIKVDPEDAYQKAEVVESNLEEMKTDIRDLYNNAKNNWLPLRDKDEFEERPITEAVNLIFEHRRDRMSVPPEWS